MKSKNGKITFYLYPVLEAKLVTKTGFCISLATDPIAIEWIINDNDKVYENGDCELKAFQRLAQKLKELFPACPFAYWQMHYMPMTR